MTVKNLTMKRVQEFCGPRVLQFLAENLSNRGQFLLGIDSLNK